MSGESRQSDARSSSDMFNKLETGAGRPVCSPESNRIAHLREEDEN